MKNIQLIVSVWFCFTCLLYSQESSIYKTMKSVNQSTMIGLGKTTLDDTYISPITYDGTAISLIHDRLKSSNLFNNTLIQNQFRIQTAITKNPTSSASEYWGSLYYNLNGLYHIFNIENLRLYGGGGPEASLGGIYNVRNSNNPGSLKTYVNLNLSAMTIFNWRQLTFRWQLSTPFVGVFFSPEYGHSYYEIFTLGNNRGTIHLGSFHNQLALRSYFTLDIPVNNITFRAGYLWDYYSTDENKLITRTNTHQFVIGLAFESVNFGGKRARNNSMIEGIYY